MTMDRQTERCRQLGKNTVVNDAKFINGAFATKAGSGHLSKFTREVKPMLLFNRCISKLVHYW